ncbi:SET domain-containing protein [Setomelanomma holmii]|uniref:SET domain-containing protein n=1 Tax=Setomelanomma holmii TaxID=210430 RepID=A0A9P4GWW3_9PLEO|nr:SET domain-containing protein [Setomelanomma holmii]
MAIINPVAHISSLWLELIVPDETPIKCASKSECTIRAARVECSSECGSTCANQGISRGNFLPFHYLEVRETILRGKGVFTKVFSPKGTLVIEYKGRQISQATRRQRGYNLTYVLQWDVCIVDRNYGGNESKYINHACEPNLKVKAWIVKGQQRLVLRANSDIPLEQELTTNYKRGRDCATAAM